MNKRFCVTYSYVISEDRTVLAENKIEAKKKLKEILPDVRIDDVWELVDPDVAGYR